MKIPKKLGHIWIGPLDQPQQIMKTWVEKHPDWDYQLYGNAYLKKNRFETARQIREYMRRGAYAGAADLLRYEILWREGGYLAGADSICLHPVDPLFEDEGEIYTVYENEFLRGQLVAPIVASVPGHPFLRLLIDHLKAIDPVDLDVPWKTTGNWFVAEMIEKYRPDITIWPSYTLIPEHHLGRVYKGPGKVYAHQLFGSTTGELYTRSTLRARLIKKLTRRYDQRARERLAARKKKSTD